MKKSKPLYRFFKRIFDIVASLLAIIILSPFFLIICIIIRIDSKGKPFYRSKRIGKNNKIIKVIKFRSMKIGSDSLSESLTKEEFEQFRKNYKLEKDPRVTKVGKFIRKTSIDELPQIFNIFVGDMSFVGPRPIVYEEYKMFWTKCPEVFSVRPGLTGMWGVNGRSLTTYEQRIDYEVYYVNHRSLWLDFKIIIKTIGVVLTSKGAV